MSRHGEAAGAISEATMGALGDLYSVHLKCNPELHPVCRPTSRGLLGRSLPGSRMLCKCRRQLAVECGLLRVVVQSPDTLCRRKCLAFKHCESLY